MTTVEILRAAKARIDTPEKWWDGGHSRGTDCLVLAGHEVSAWGSEKAYVQALGRAIGVPAFPPNGFMRWNDSHTHAEVMAAFDQAIANEEAREQEHNVTPLPELAAA